MKPIELLDEINKYCDTIYDDFCDDNCCEWAESFRDRLSCNVGIEFGATKLVIIPENLNFVLKIPFFGKYIEEWIENEEYTVAETDPDWDWNEAGHYEYKFYPFEWAAVREGDDEWDYCAAETTIYELAEQEGLENYFAAEYLLGFIQEMPVYVQDKVCPCENASSNCDRSLNAEENEKYRHYLSNFNSCSNANRFPSTWAFNFINVYGEAELTRLIQFLHDHQVNDDWHQGNLAYIEDTAEFPVPILLDYSNYKD